MQQELFSGAFIRQPSLVGRLFGEFAEATREFSTNPKQYLSTAFKGDGLGGRRRKALLELGMAMGIVVYAIFFTTILIIWWYQHHKPASVDEPETLLTRLVNADDFKQQPIDMKKAKEKAGGGGGGGRNTPTPPSKGQLPQFSLTPPIIAPRPEPQLKPPSLPVMETVQVDPRLQPKRDDLAPTGLPTGVPGPPSAGPGSGGGMGSGSGGGMGSGDGTGVGPGRGYNMGGGDPRLGGGTGAVATSVDTLPVALNKPSPRFTEEARRNKIQGKVLTRVLVTAEGRVKTVSIVRGLPDGLDEEAIQAAYQLRFKPATKNGQPVAYWIRVEIEFNLR